MTRPYVFLAGLFTRPLPRYLSRGPLACPRWAAGPLAFARALLFKCRQDLLDGL